MIRPDDLFYHVFDISDLFCEEEDKKPPNITIIELDLTGWGEPNMSVFLGGVTFINVEVIE